ncbi:Peptide deformylase [Streptococcus sp. HSISM1]|nr:Peptide deformylase [Streptococcus sp. HSISM1]
MKRGWDKSPSLSIVFGLSSKTQWLSAQSTALRWRIELAKQVS